MMTLLKGWMNQQKIKKQPTLDQYPMFEWTPGISTMYNTSESEDEYLNEENSDVEIMEDIVK